MANQLEQLEPIQEPQNIKAAEGGSLGNVHSCSFGQKCRSLINFAL